MSEDDLIMNPVVEFPGGEVERLAEMRPVKSPVALREPSGETIAFELGLRLKNLIGFPWRHRLLRIQYVGIELMTADIVFRRDLAYDDWAVYLSSRFTSALNKELSKDSQDNVFRVEVKMDADDVTRIFSAPVLRNFWLTRNYETALRVFKGLGYQDSPVHRDHLLQLAKDSIEGR